MKKFYFPALSIILAAVVFQPNTVGAEADPLAQEEAESNAIKDRPEWNETLKAKFNLTPEQIKSLQNQGLNYPQMAITAGLAQKSGKSIDEVAKMRSDGKKGWGAIAKELGVHPKEIGQSVREMRHSVRDGRQAERAERREDRMTNRAERHAERAARNAARKAEKAERKGN